MSITSELLDIRLNKVFPQNPNVWASYMPNILNDCKGQTLEVCGFQVMQSWEKPLMKAMAETACSSKGAVLEIGYGLGICAQYVQDNQPKIHVIIESNHEIANWAREKFKHDIYRKKVIVYESFWEDIDWRLLRETHAPEGFDGIIFDTFPLAVSELRKNHFSFFRYANDLLSKIGVFTYFSDEKISLSKSHFEQIYQYFQNPNIRTSIIQVKPWKNCEYWFWPSITHVSISNLNYLQE